MRGIGEFLVKVLISTDPIKQPLTGIGRYTYELVKEYQQSNILDDLKYLHKNRVLNNFDVNLSLDTKPLTSTLKIKKNVINFLKNSPVADIYRKISFYKDKEIINKHSGYIYHGTNFFIPNIKNKSISTFHDLSPFTMSHCIEKNKRIFLQKELKKTVERATFFITDTEHTRNELIDFFNIEPERVKSVHLACTQDYNIKDKNDVISHLACFNLNYKKYFLCVSTIEPRKNIEILLDSYSNLPRYIKDEYPLVLVGHPGWCSEQIHQKIRTLSFTDNVVYLKYVNEERLPYIYSGARCFIFPSLYEGFGLPILEAMSCGCPVISSNSSCLPEVGSTAAEYFSPTDTDQLTMLMQKFAEDDSYYEKFVHAGILRANDFSWKKCAMETIDIYDLVGRL